MAKSFDRIVTTNEDGRVLVHYQLNKEYYREYMRQRVANFKASGLCVDCGLPTVGGSRCASHNYNLAIRNREYQKRLGPIASEKSRHHYAKCKAEGRCPSCGVELNEDETTVLCNGCGVK